MAFDNILFNMTNDYPFHDLFPIPTIWPWIISEGHSSYLKTWLYQYSEDEQFNIHIMLTYQMSFSMFGDRSKYLLLNYMYFYMYIDYLQ